MSSSSIVLAHEPPFSVGAAEVHPATREIRHAGKTAILEPRVMQVLVTLHRAKGSVVSKDDLVTSCWDGRIVGDDAINRVIGRLRHEASAHAGDTFRIETITRVGYRLVESGATGQRASVDRRGLVIGGAAAAVAAGAGVFGWRMFTRPKINDPAQALLEEGRAAMRQATPDQLTNAVAKFRSASELDPSNAEIWGELAVAYQMQKVELPANQRQFAQERSANAQSRALSIDPDNGDALAAKVMSMRLFGNWAAFELAARDALKRQPDSVTLNRLVAYVLLQVGRPGAAIPYLDRAYAGDPMAAGNYVFRMFALWSVGRLDEAENVIDHALSLWPRHFGIWFSRIYFLAYTGRAQEALAMVLDTASRPIGIPEWNFDFTAQQVQALATGRPADIDKAMATCLEVAKRGAGFAENVTMFAASVGRIDDAYRVLDSYFFDRGFAIGDRRWSSEQGMYSDRRDRLTYFLFDPPLADFRRDPRFEPLTRTIGLADYWRKTGTRPDYLLKD
jgi:DNA-binding winged helix-turn-helix (wHTH) protein/Flp pilus assembly protein TadD